MKWHQHSGLAVLLLAIVLAPAITLSQPETSDPGIIGLRYVSIVVRDYDEALHWYTGVLGLEKIEDGNFGNGKRWLVVAPRGRGDIGIVLEIAQPVAANVMGGQADPISDYASRIGKETRWVFEVADCRKFYELASKRGVKFVETPVEQKAWGVTESMFQDLYGNIFVVYSKHPKAQTSR
jgi:catechol 2,3-dioxygenase-like lactoylglutathione lyase family enzyme